jgi:hypothetical protein
VTHSIGRCCFSSCRTRSTPTSIPPMSLGARLQPPPRTRYVFTVFAATPMQAGRSLGRPRICRCSSMPSSRNSNVSVASAPQCILGATNPVGASPRGRDYLLQCVEIGAAAKPAITACAVDWSKHMRFAHRHEFLCRGLGEANS